MRDRWSIPLGANILAYVRVPGTFFRLRQSPVEIEHCLASDECCGSLALRFCLLSGWEPFFSTCRKSANAIIVTHAFVHHQLVSMSNVVVIDLMAPLFDNRLFAWLFWFCDWICLVSCSEVRSLRVDVLSLLKILLALVRNLYLVHYLLDQPVRSNIRQLSFCLQFSLTFETWSISWSHFVMTIDSIIALHSVQSFLFLVLDKPFPLFFFVQLVFEFIEELLFFLLVSDLGSYKLLVDLVLIDKLFCLPCTYLCLLIGSFLSGMTGCFIANTGDYDPFIGNQICLLFTYSLFFLEWSLSLCHGIVVILGLACKLWVFPTFILPLIFLLFDHRYKRLDLNFNPSLFSPLTFPVPCKILINLLLSALSLSSNPCFRHWCLALVVFRLVINFELTSSCWTAIINIRYLEFFISFSL